MQPFRLVVAFAAASALIFPTAKAADSAVTRAPITIVIHGGAGALAPGLYTPEEEAAYKAKLSEALDAGYAVLEKGGRSIDAVEAAIVIMEDSPLFNAGKGAVFTKEGRNELDAAIMDGKTVNAGAVAGVTHVKNPIKLARAVMDQSPHVMFARSGAEEFARTHGIEMVKTSYFRTERRWKEYQDALKADREKKGASLPYAYDLKFGTVGAVALDKDGNIAAGTSTGGLTLKEYGRVGDSPIIGAGTYADNRSCAVSSTGWGEYFIRLVIARDVCAQVEYAHKSVVDAAADVIHNRLQSLGGDGGVIVLDPHGNYVVDFNSVGMFRGVKQEGHTPKVAIYKDWDAN
ncbi:MAG TPA: isoaspartyl peptidase/L-asparaginase [Parvularculaceae bacterium]|nr:isoaspartyl peptidase/L-asparaginase [Parvularculaceae bacterium]